MKLSKIEQARKAIEAEKIVRDRLATAPDDLKPTLRHILSIFIGETNKKIDILEGK